MFTQLRCAQQPRVLTQRHAVSATHQCVSAAHNIERLLAGSAGHSAHSTACPEAWGMRVSGWGLRMGMCMAIKGLYIALLLPGRPALAGNVRRGLDSSIR